MDQDSPFWETGAMFPDEMSLVTVPEGTHIRDALELMLGTRQAFLPVLRPDGSVLGVFSQWSLTKFLAAFPGISVDELNVDEACGEHPAVTVRSPFDAVLDALNQSDAVLVESPYGLQAVATHATVADYLARATKPYVLLKEIELGIREIISLVVPASDLAATLERVLSGKYANLGKPVPTSLRELSFEDYRSVISNKDCWPGFHSLLGGLRESASTKLKRVGQIRNEIFHFRSEVSVSDFQALVATRDWLLRSHRVHQGGEAGKSV